MTLWNDGQQRGVQSSTLKPRVELRIRDIRCPLDSIPADVGSVIRTYIACMRQTHSS